MTGYGNTIVLEHIANDDGEVIHTLYAHMHKPSPLTVGTKIRTDESVGPVGNTGIGSGAHLHFEVLRNGKKGAPNLVKGHETINPREFDITKIRAKNASNTSQINLTASCCFPVVSENGAQYQTAEDVYKLLEKETSGFYLLSAHNFWHGGLHFTDASVSHHVNKQAIRCMMDGKVVAYRLNKDYLISNWAGNTLQFSSSFCLVQHDYESPANSDEGSNKGKKNKLTFYSLYMHLAPYSVYANKDSQVAKKDQKNQLKIKQAIRVRKGEAATQSAPPVLGHLGIGSIVDLTGETAQFSVQEQSGLHSYRFVEGSVSEVQGKTDATVTKGAVIWVVDDSKYTEHITPSSAIPSEMKPPAYWQCKMKGIVKNRVNARAIKDNSKAFSEKNSEALGLLNITAEFEFETKEILTCQIGGKSHRIAKATLIKGGYADKAGQPPSPFWVCIDEPFVTLEAQPPTQFDEVIKLNNPIPIKAGDAIGYMGLYEVPKMPAASGLKTSKHQVHIEIFTTESDANVKAFLDNQAGLKSGKQYLKVKKDTCIYVRNEDKKKVSFATAGLKTCEDTVFELDVCKKEKDSNNAVYYKINQLPVPLNHKQDGYIGEKEAEILSQYDLSKLGFLMLEEKNTNSDGYLDPEKMPDFFQQLYKEIDTDGKNGVDSTEIAAAFRDKSKRDKLVKLVAKHPSEWHSLTINTIKQTLSSWSADNLEKETEELLEHEKARMEKLEWMSKLFSPMVWHFNPVFFVYYVITKDIYNDEDVIYLAKTLYGEARGQNISSKKAVAWIIRNRLNDGGFGRTYKDVVTAPYQFTCWNKLIDRVNYDAIQDPAGTAWDDCLSIAREVVSASEIENIIPMAVNYYSPRAQKQLHKLNPLVYKEKPVFAIESKRVLNPQGIKDEDFRFYKK